MKINTIILAMGTAVALCSGAVRADDPAPVTNITVPGGTIHFKGKLVAAPCAVSTDSDGQIVNLGEYTTRHFKSEGLLGTLKPFDIKLQDCDTEMAKTAQVAFSGRQDSQNKDLLAIDAGLSGDNTQTATGVGIQILDAVSNIVRPDGSTFSTPHKLINGENVLKFAAQYKSTAAATAGDANADATFIMQYQ